MRDRILQYGASIWCDPELWIPEAARLLRPDGELVFMRTSTLSILCTPVRGPAGEALVRPRRGLGRLDWAGEDPTTEFHLPHGALLRLLRRSGFELLDLVEVLAPEGAADHPFYRHEPARWARRWPAEELWRARKSKLAPGPDARHE